MEYGIICITIDDNKLASIVAYPIDTAKHFSDYDFKFESEIHLQSFLDYLSIEDLYLRNKITKINSYIHHYEMPKEYFFNIETYFETKQKIYRAYNEEYVSNYILDCLMSIFTAWQSIMLIDQHQSTASNSMRNNSLHKSKLGGEVVFFNNSNSVYPTHKIDYLYILGEDKKNNYKDLSRLKIGITNDLKKRLYTYMTHSPVNVKYIKFYPIINLSSSSTSSVERVENILKSKLEILKIYQEWFNIRLKDLIYIIELTLKEEKHPLFDFYHFHPRS
ncbi:GIY-YIG nuclease family protein, partial [Alphaproteobacteria bacterium]|nr:GIY-YIG nuclease family protein [Alphaproteobacteria bacterium]